MILGTFLVEQQTSARFSLKLSGGIEDLNYIVILSILILANFKKGSNKLTY